jgi:hexosaminidase
VKHYHFFKLIFLLFLCTMMKNPLAIGQDDIPGLIPLPKSIVPKQGTFLLTPSTKLFIANSSTETLQIGQYLSDQLNYLTGLQIQKGTKVSGHETSITLALNDKSMNNEAYSLLISPSEVSIRGASSAGLFYGVQTFLQLIYPNEETDGHIDLPCLQIEDEPVFQWRGMHLDVSRHFYSVDFVKKMLDAMATLKLNTFHWHLTDDQGWRIEIKKYPALTEKGAWRKETMEGHYVEKNQVFDHMRYGGYYTQEEIKDVVKYARERYITIVPEIEMPGHAVAALSAYPEYSCTGGPFETYTKWGVSDDVYCAGKDETFEFLENILSEVIDLFPGEYIHIGGDECPKTRWKACPVCQKRIADENLKDELELQSYFVKRIEKFVASKGKKLIGWDEILEGGLPERATVMSWRGNEGGIEASENGHDVVMTPGSHCYFDHYQGNPEFEPLAIGGLNTLENVYSYNPVPESLSDEAARHILGSQANVWTEYLTNENKVEYMIFPRLCALAEVLWSPQETRNYSQFLTRLQPEIKRLQKYRINYRPLGEKSSRH